jgi:hypothetical protein
VLGLPQVVPVREGRGRSLFIPLIPLVPLVEVHILQLQVSCIPGFLITGEIFIIKLAFDDTSDSPWPGIIKLFPARESLVCDIPAGNGKIASLILKCNMKLCG